MDLSGKRRQKRTSFDIFERRLNIPFYSIFQLLTGFFLYCTVDICSCFVFETSCCLGSKIPEEEECSCKCCSVNMPMRFISWYSVQDRVPLVERAIYASLCGNLRRLLPYLHSWSDYLWAYLRALVDQKVEYHIRSSHAGKREFVDLPDAYPEET